MKTELQYFKLSLSIQVYQFQPNPVTNYNPKNIMQNPQFILSTKKKGSVSTFLQIYEAKGKGEVRNDYLAQIYNLTKMGDQKIKEALEFNECIFSDQFQFSTSNIVRIEKIERTSTFCAHYVQKYDKDLLKYLKDRKKGRISEQMSIKIMEDVLKGLATILQAGYRPVGIRADNVVRFFSKNPQQGQIWKIKNVVYSSNVNFDQQHFLTFEQNFSPPEIYSRRNTKDHEYDQSEEYTNALLVWSLGVLFARLLGIQSKLDSKKKLSEFRDRQFNLMDILYIRNQYSTQFLKVVASMLHFDNKKRMKLKDLFKQTIFSEQLRKRVTKKIINLPIQQIKKAVQGWKIDCSLFQFRSIF